jgi:hypothetical protein
MQMLKVFLLKLASARWKTSVGQTHEMGVFNAHRVRLIMSMQPWGKTRMWVRYCNNGSSCLSKAVQRKSFQVWAYNLGDTSLLHRTALAFFGAGRETTSKSFFLYSNLFLSDRWPRVERALLWRNRQPQASESRMIAISIGRYLHHSCRPSVKSKTLLRLLDDMFGSHGSETFILRNIAQSLWCVVVRCWKQSRYRNTCHFWHAGHSPT